jgi:hypothetical protein
MKQIRQTRSDSGSAAIELLLFGLVLQLVITGFGLDLLRQQRAQIASQSLARQVVRLVIANPQDSSDRVQDLLSVTAENQGKNMDDFKVSWSPSDPKVGDWVVAQASVSGQTQFAVMRVGK